MHSSSAKEKDRFLKVIDTSYASLLGIKMGEIEPNSLTLYMPLSSEEHANASGAVHGGVIMSLADTAMGCACFNHGNRVTTMDLNINFIKGAKPQGILKAIATIIHTGSRTMVVEAEVRDGEGVFIAKSRGTFFITGKVEDDATS